jgi:hypothetical protein
MKLNLLVFSTLLLIISATQLQLDPSYSFLSLSEDSLSSALSSLDSWIQWKNSYSRFDRHLHEIPNKLVPETEGYQEGIIMQSWWAMILVLIEILGLSGFLVLHFKEDDQEDQGIAKVPRDIRYTPGTLTLVSFVLFFTGGLTLLIADGSIRELTEKAVEITAESVMNTSKVVSEMKHDLVNMNMVAGI